MKLNWINTLPDGETTRKEFAFLPDKEGVENHVVNLYPESHSKRWKDLAVPLRTQLAMYIR